MLSPKKNLVVFVYIHTRASWCLLGRCRLWWSSMMLICPRLGISWHPIRWTLHCSDIGIQYRYMYKSLCSHAVWYWVTTGDIHVNGRQSTVSCGYKLTGWSPTTSDWRESSRRALNRNSTTLIHQTWRMPVTISLYITCNINSTWLYRCLLQYFGVLCNIANNSTQFSAIDNLAVCSLFKC